MMLKGFPCFLLPSGECSSGFKALILAEYRFAIVLARKKKATLLRSMDSDNNISEVAAEKRKTNSPI